MLHVTKQQSIQLALHYDVTHHRCPGLVSELFRTSKAARRIARRKHAACYSHAGFTLTPQHLHWAIGDGNEAWNKLEGVTVTALVWLHSSCGNYMESGTPVCV